MGFPAFTPILIPKCSSFNDLRSMQIYICVCIHIYTHTYTYIQTHTYLYICSFHQCLATSGTYSVGRNINYVQISDEKAEVRCSTVLLSSLLGAGVLRATRCIAVALEIGCLPALEAFLSPSSTEKLIM